MEGSASNEWITAFGGSWWSMCPTRLLTSAVPFQTYEDARWDAVAREQRRLDRNLTDRRGFNSGSMGGGAGACGLNRVEAASRRTALFERRRANRWLMVRHYEPAHAVSNTAVWQGGAPPPLEPPAFVPPLPDLRARNLPGARYRGAAGNTRRELGSKGV